MLGDARPNTLPLMAAKAAIHDNQPRVILGLVPRIHQAISQAAKWILGIKPKMTTDDRPQFFRKLKNAVPASPASLTLPLRPETEMRIEPPVLYCWLKKVPT